MTGLEQIRAAAESQGGLLADLLVKGDAAPVFDEFAAKAPRSAASAAAYAAVLEGILEGYLLHHGRPRIFAVEDDDACVLAGDFLYAYGLDRLTRLGDPFAVGVLSKLIACCSRAELAAVGGQAVAALWFASAVQILCAGEAASRAIDAVKESLDDMQGPATEDLVQITMRLCDEGGLACEAMLMRSGLAAALSSPVAL